jgi:hypothetical protein
MVGVEGVNTPQHILAEMVPVVVVVVVEVFLMLEEMLVLGREIKEVVEK